MAEVRELGFQRGLRGFCRSAPQSDAESTEERVARGRDRVRELRVSNAPVLLASGADAHLDGGTSLSSKRDDDPLVPPHDRAGDVWRNRTAGLQRIGDRVDLVDAASRQWPQQRGHVRVLADDDRNQDLPFLNARVGEVADLRVDPAALPRVGREHDQPGIRLLESRVDLRDDIVARRDDPLVEPGLDAALMQRAGERLDR
jgi:hypothetical protein